MTIAVVTVVIVTYFSKNNLTPRQPMRFLRAAFRDLAMFLGVANDQLLQCSIITVLLLIVKK